MNKPYKAHIGEWKVITQTLSPEHAEQDVKLMRAAPTLLASCQMAREELVFGGNWEAAKKVIDEAIKKATIK